MSDNGERSRRLTDVGWVGWTLIISASASIAAAAYNYGASNESLRTMKEAMIEHNKNCAELHRAVQQLAILAQADSIRIDQLYRHQEKR